MFRHVMAVSVLLIAAVATASAQECLHGSSETAAQKARRERAIDMAVRINLAQGIITGPAPQTRRYRRLDELVNIPPTPAGFDLRFYTDGSTYAFFLKDTLDPCRYVVFSDQDKRLYEAIAQAPQPRVIPVETN